MISSLIFIQIVILSTIFSHLLGLSTLTSWCVAVYLHLQKLVSENGGSALTSNNKVRDGCRA